VSFSPLRKARTGRRDSRGGERLARSNWRASRSGNKPARAGRRASHKGPRTSRSGPRASIRVNGALVPVGEPHVRVNGPLVPVGEPSVEGKGGFISTRRWLDGYPGPPSTGRREPSAYDLDRLGKEPLGGRRAETVRARKSGERAQTTEEGAAPDSQPGEA
jgi:hypothetical protein